MMTLGVAGGVGGAGAGVAGKAVGATTGPATEAGGADVETASPPRRRIRIEVVPSLKSMAVRSNFFIRRPRCRIVWTSMGSFGSVSFSDIPGAPHLAEDHPVGRT
jgi:hypothetical protein